MRIGYGPGISSNGGDCSLFHYFFSKFSPGIEVHWNARRVSSKNLYKKSGSEQCKVMDCGEYIMFCPDLS